MEARNPYPFHHTSNTHFVGMGRIQVHFVGEGCVCEAQTPACGGQCPHFTERRAPQASYTPGGYEGKTGQASCDAVWFSSPTRETPWMTPCPSCFAFGSGWFL